MEFIGNYNHWIKQEWLDYMLDNDGHFFPRDYPPEEFNTGGGLSALFPEHGEWSRKCVCCITFEKDNLPFNIELPIDTTGYKTEYWFLKIPVGMGQPLHQDYNNPEYTEIIRYWMPLQEYEKGHMFIHDSDKIFTDYRKGDLYRYTDIKMWHTGGNLGQSTRLTFNMTLFR
jgi:hypothetical protein